MTDRRRYRFVGPTHLLAGVRSDREGRRIGSPDDLAGWLATRDVEELAEPFTFVVGLDGVLRLAARRSEHVHCAGGSPVLSAGELTVARDGGRWVVTGVSNHSTGYCPEPDSWPAVNDALDRAGVPHPGQFTDLVVFRRCPHCQERNLVKDDDPYCAVCETELPSEWNLDPRP